MITTNYQPKTKPAPKRKPQRGTGIVKGNPKSCLICQKEVKKGERGLRYKSPSEPDLPAYSILVHEGCERRAR